MKNVILEELARAWESEVKSDTKRNGSPDADLDNAKKNGFNAALLSSAEQLKEVVRLFG